MKKTTLTLAALAILAAPAALAGNLNPAWIEPAITEPECDRLAPPWSDRACSSERRGEDGTPAAAAPADRDTDRGEREPDRRTLDKPEPKPEPQPEPQPEPEPETPPTDGEDCRDVRDERTDRDKTRKEWLDRGGKPKSNAKPGKGDGKGQQEGRDFIERERDCKVCGNASGNNGKGGNYDRTGHDDSGKGKGKGR